MMKRYLSVLPMILFCLGLNAQQQLLTVAEKSGFTSTSEYSDVIGFISQLKEASRFIRTENIATTIEGRGIPLMIIGNPLPSSPGRLPNDKRIVVYIQANIHAGEVEGKEAVLMFVRDLLREKEPAVLKNIILLVCPIFNADGNEKISKENRPDQNGPVNGVGVRYNGQYLDLNRDAMKAESPEVRGVITNVFNKWDPAIFMDCHTTNGSYHVEPVTFTWMVNPNGDNSLISYMRDAMMPEVSRKLSVEYKTENCFYGEFVDMLHPEKGFILDAAEPRYMSNYYGLRNRLGILNENYVYAPFRDRVYGCYNLIRSLIDYSAEHHLEINQMLKSADDRQVNSPADSFALEYKIGPLPGKIKIRSYEAELVRVEGDHPFYKNTGRQVDVSVPYLVDARPVKSIALPFAYLLTVKDPAIIETLKLHGIKLEKMISEKEITVKKFNISGLKSSERLNQGHHNNIIYGDYSNVNMKFPAGTIIIKTSQPLGRLAAYLLEAQSNDGFMTWNFFDKYLVPQWGQGFNPYPVYRLMLKTDLNMEAF